MNKTSTQELERTMESVRSAQERFASYSQEQVDAIFRQAALAAAANRIALAKLAVEETGMGIVEDKVIKNHFASEYIYNRYKDEITCGTIEFDESSGIRKIAEPIGLVAGIIPTTNPTSTVIFKILLCLKTRNGLILSPHPRARRCTVEAAKILLEAAVAAGAPEGIIGWIEDPSVEASNTLMQSCDLILATGGPGMVKAAYSSGKPAIGVGAGNTPVIIDETADIRMAVNSILLSKTLDNGVICASEQAVVAVKSVYAAIRREFLARGAYLVTGRERTLLAKTLFNNGRLNADIVGQSASRIAQLAGFSVPEETKILLAESEVVGPQEPFSMEKLSPVLALYRANDFNHALDIAESLVQLGGLGHTSALYTDSTHCQDRVETFGHRMKTGRTIINMPSSQGALGDLYNFRMEPSLTLGCGSWGGNSVSENVGVKHLLNIKTVAERRENMLWFKVPPSIYCKSGCLLHALEELRHHGKRRAFIVTDRVLYSLGMLDDLLFRLDDLGIRAKVFQDVDPDPTLQIAERGAEEMRQFEPDTIIAFGGGSPMDAAKIMWVLYEHPEADFRDLALRFMDIRKRVYAFPKTGRLASLVAIPTTAGTGSEVTPFAVITDEKTGTKYPLADYQLTPDMAVVDASLMRTMPASLTAASGIDALTHALEAYVSVLATDMTNGLALEAIRIIFAYLPRAFENGANDPEAREKMAHASTVAGMAFANAFLGVCHSMAHKLGAAHHIPHGIANALLIEQVIAYNASENPSKQTAFPQNRYPDTKKRYACIADALQLGGETDDEKVTRLIGAVADLKSRIKIASSIQAYGIDRESFEASLECMSEQAFDDQCTPANPRYPLIDEIRALYREAYAPGQRIQQTRRIEAVS